MLVLYVITYSAPGRIRTLDLIIRSDVFCPTELQVRIVPRLGIEPRTFALKGRSYFLLSLRSLNFSAGCRARTDRP